MSTRAQKSANSANAQLSTGPRTEEGKQKVSGNSAKHYMTAKQLIVPGENADDFDELHQGLEQSWNPANPQESLLVEQIAQNAWRLMRARRLEAATFEYLMPNLEPVPINTGGTKLRAIRDHEQAMARAFVQNAKVFDNLRRYTPPIERAYHNAIAELTKLQKQRKKEEIGSVSQKPEPGQVRSAAAAPEVTP